MERETVHCSNNAGIVVIKQSFNAGPYIIMISEKTEDDCFVSSSIYHMCISETSVNIIRSCYTISPGFAGHTLGGMVQTVSKDSITLTNLRPNTYIYLSIVDQTKMEKMEQNVTRLENENKDLKVALDSLQQKVEEMYYAPGMPGYVQAESDFTQLCSA